MTESSNHLETPWRRTRRAIWLLWRTWEWPVVGILALAGLTLGYVGFSVYFKSEPIWNLHPWEVLYRTLQLLALNFTWFNKPLHWTLQFARLILPTLAVYTGVRAIVTLYYDHLRVMWTQAFARRHIVVCGLGRKGLHLTRKLCERGDKVVVIEHDAHNTLIAAARNAGATLLVGDATEPYMLRRAAVCRARHVVAVSRDDGLNAEISTRALELARRCNQLLKCSCHVFSSRLRQLLDRHREETGAWGRDQLRFFNAYENGAEVLLDLDPPFPAGSTAAPHVLVLGVGRMGEALIVRLTVSWKATRGENSTKLRITMGDRLAPEKKEFLLSEYPDLADTWDLDPVEVEVKSPRFQAGEPLYEGGRYLTLTRAYVCFDDDSLGLTAALTIEDRLKAKGRRIPIVLRTSAYGGLTALLPRVEEPSCLPECIKAFPVIQHTCTPELVLEGAHPRPPLPASRPDSPSFGLAVRAVIHDEEGRILLLRRSGSNKSNPGVWEFPGGKTNPGENFADALVREVKEECGLDVVPQHAVGTVQTEQSGLHVVHLVMETGAVGGTLHLSKEHDESAWVLAQNLKRLNVLAAFRSFIEHHVRDKAEY